MSTAGGFGALTWHLWCREAERLVRAPLFLACLALIATLQFVNVASVLQQTDTERDPELVQEIERLRALQDPSACHTAITALEAQRDEWDARLEAANLDGRPDPALWAGISRTGTLLDRLTHVANYPATLEQQIANATRRAAIGTRQDDFSVRSLRLQADRFADVKNWIEADPTRLHIDREVGFDRLDALWRTNLISLFALYVFVWLIFGRDRELGMVGLVRTSRAGDGPLLLARVGLALAATLVLQLVLWIPSLLAIGADGGFGQFDRALQSMQRFSYGGLRLTVAGFLQRFVWLKLLGGLLATCLFVLISMLSVAAGLNHLLSFAVYALSAVLSQRVGAASPFNALRFLNPLAVLDTVPLLARHQDVKLFSFAVGRPGASLLFMALGIGLALAGIIWRWKRDLRPWQALILPQLSLPVPRRLPPLLLQGLGRMLRQRGVVVLLALTLVALWQTRPEPPQRYYGIERERYLNSILRHQGPLDEAKWQAIEAERAAFDALRTEQAELAGDSSEQAVLRRQSIAHQLSAEETFLHFYRQVEALVPWMRGGHAVEILDEARTAFWFQRPRADALRGLLAAMLALLLFLPVPAEDSRLAIRPLIETSRRGHRALGRMRRRLAWPFGLAIAVLASLPQLIAAVGWRARLPLGALAQSAPQLVGLGGPTSFARIIVLIALLRILTTVVQIRLMQEIAARIASLPLALAAATILIALPLLAHGFGVSMIWWPLTSGFLATSSLPAAQSSGLLVLLGVQVLLLIGMRVFGGERANHGPLLRSD